MPQAPSIVCVCFLSPFALDVFSENLSFWQTVLALTIRLIPSFVLIVALALDWRREWIGAALFAGAGLLYITLVLSMSRPVSAAFRLVSILTIPGPAFLIAGLFLANWLKRGGLRNSA